MSDTVERFLEDLRTSGEVLELLHSMEATVPVSSPSSASLCHALNRAWATLGLLPKLSTPPQSESEAPQQTDCSYADDVDSPQSHKCAPGLLSEFWAQVALDYSWEHLHSGYWQDVKLFWRQAYSLAALLKSINLILQGKDQEALIEIDKGILMGAPILNHSLHQLATLLCKKLMQTDLTVSTSNVGDDQASRKIGKVKFRNYTPQAASLNTAGTTTKETGHMSCDLKDVPLVDMERRLPTVHCPSLEDFYNHHMTCSVPVVISGSMDHWPAYAEKKWK